MKSIFLATLISVSFLSAANAENEQLKADRENVNTSCASEAATAGCGSEKVGTGLLKCIHAYKKAHKSDFTISDSCKSSMKKLREDRHAKK